MYYTCLPAGCSDPCGWLTSVAAHAALHVATLMIGFDIDLPRPCPQSEYDKKVKEMLAQKEQNRLKLESMYAQAVADLEKNNKTIDQLRQQVEKMTDEAGVRGWAGWGGVTVAGLGEWGGGSLGRAGWGALLSIPPVQCMPPVLPIPSPQCHACHLASSLRRWRTLA